MYNYEELKPTLFTEENQKLFLGIRDQVQGMIKQSGAVDMGHAMELPTGAGAANSWTMMACVDRLVELGELREIPTNGAGQDRVFVSGKRR